MVKRMVTLTTDFGLSDGNVGVMKGVIQKIAPGVQIADLTHLIEPQNILQTAFILERHTPYFPAETVHVVVVDPGVGTGRRPIACRLGEQFFVAPDNGLLTPLIENAEENRDPVKFVHLDQPWFWLPQVSDVFHGRDIFSPVGAHLAKGVKLEALGTCIDDPVRVTMARPEVRPEQIVGEVVHIDHFGNVITNIKKSTLETLEVAEIEICDVRIFAVHKTFGDDKPGSLVALYGSTGNLLVAEVNGDGARRLGAGIGDQITVHLLQ